MFSRSGAKEMPFEYNFHLPAAFYHLSVKRVIIFHICQTQWLGKSEWKYDSLLPGNETVIRGDSHKAKQMIKKHMTNFNRKMPQPTPNVVIWLINNEGSFHSQGEEDGWGCGGWGGGLVKCSDGEVPW